MLVVSNTSPISNLAVIGRLELLHDQLGTVIITPAVVRELACHPHLTARQNIQQAIAKDWLRVVTPKVPVANNLISQLDPGEAEALALALELKASLILLDETAARAKARELGLAHTGVLGLLREARRAQKIPALRIEIARLRTEAHFFITPGLENILLASVGE